MNDVKTYNLQVLRDASVHVFNLNNEIDPDIISKNILEFKIQQPESNLSNVVGWHGGYFSHKQSNIFDELISVVEEKTRLALNNSNFNISVVHVWPIVYEKTNGAVRHNHNDAFYAAVYYASATPKSSPLKFDDNLTIIPETGMLVVFPSWLYHEVPPMRFEHQRITVGFNINCSLKTYEEVFKIS